MIKVLFALFFSTTLLYGQSTTDFSPPLIEKHEEFNVSLIQLIATPEKYHGKKVLVIGYLNIEFEGNAIYLHEEDYKHGLDKNAFWVDFSKEIKPEKYSKSYVIIEGTFNMNRQGHFGLFSGTIENITRLDRWN